MNKLKLLFVIFLLLPSSSYGSPAADLEVGLSLPLSGPLAAIGMAVSNGIELAEELHGDKLKGLKFLRDDNAYDAKRALASFEKMKLRSQMQLVYIWGSPTCMAVAPIAERKEFPLVCFSGDPKPGLDYVFSFNNPASDYALEMLKYLKSNAFPRIAIVYSEIPFYSSLTDSLEQQLKKSGSVYRRESLLPGSQDFSSLISRLKSENYDALALFLLPPQIPAFSRQMKALNYRPAVIGADTFADGEAIEQAKGWLNDAVYVDMAVNSKFAVAYEKKYKTQSNLTFAYNGYHFALLVSDILGTGSKGLMPKELVSKLQNIKTPQLSKRPMIYKTRESFGQYFSFPIELKQVD